VLLSIGIVMVHSSPYVSTVFQFLAVSCTIVRFLPALFPFTSVVTIGAFFVPGDYILVPEGVFEKAVLFFILTIIVLGIFVFIVINVRGNIFA
jgi:hypothetical protein